jgi:exodeoxyribonuclease V alpha subunit
MSDIILNDDQQKAIDMAISKPLTIICGGAGVGKTTLVKELNNRINQSCILACPTGKAAARLREATGGMDVRTIHSALSYNGAMFMAGNLNGKTIIIDEASMLDSWILYEIVKRKPQRLVLIGDDAQLPPVGSGSPFHDIIKFRQDIVCNLTICYRSSEAVYKAGTTIRNHNNPLQYDKSEDETWELRHTGTAENTQKVICDIVKKGKIDFEKDIIICCRNGEFLDPSPGTVHGLNKAIIETLYPGRAEKWIVGDRIMCLKNYADYDVWNGTTGTITGIGGNGTLWIKGDIPFLDKDTGSYVDEIEWSRDIVNDCQHAYALTVHKSQGSQYRKVIFCCLSRDSFMLLSNSLIYTAVTRTKNDCLVVGDIKAFSRGINIDKRKNTIIQQLKIQDEKGAKNDQ